MPDYEFFSFDVPHSQEWDLFVAQSQLGSIHQTSWWANFQKKIPGRDFVRGYGVRHSKTKQILSTTFCVQMKVGVGDFFWWYSPRGPVFDMDHCEAACALLQFVKKELQKSRGIFWRLDPLVPISQTFSYPFLTCAATQNYQPTDTLHIDLTQSSDVILSQMKRKGRYNIQLARKHGVTIQSLSASDITDQDIDDFWKLNQDTTQRDSFSGHEKSYYRHFLSSLPDIAVLFFAVAPDGTRIATAISTFYAHHAIYYFGASTSDPHFRKYMAPYLLQWEMMQYAKDKGFRDYDFLGIAPENKQNHPYAGISEFKWKFGGTRKTYHAGREVPLRWFWYGVYRVLKFFRS